MESHKLDHKGHNAESAVLQVLSVTVGAEHMRAVPHAKRCPPIQFVSCRQRGSNIL